jgi:hypothetical protein
MPYESAPATARAANSAGKPSESIGSDRPAHEVDRTEAPLSGNLSEAEQAVWRDPGLLARIESVLDDPSLAVPLDEAASSSSTAAHRAGTPPE